MKWGRGDSAFVLLAFAFLTVWCLTPVQNHSEAEDAFMFARNIETKPLSEMLHPHHFMYHAVMKGIYELSPGWRSYPLMVCFSRVMSVASLLMLWLLLRRVWVLSTPASVFGVLLMAGTYCFWRYSAEAEVYGFATMTALFTLLLTFQRHGFMVAAAASGGLAVSVHLMNLCLVFAAIPGRIALVGQFRKAVCFGLGAAAVFLCLWLAKEGLVADVEAVADPRFGVPSAKAVARDVIAAGQAIVSGNGLFAYERVAESAKQMLPTKNLSEETLTASAIPKELLPIITVTFCISVVFIASICFLGFCFSVRAFKSPRSPASAPLTVAILWSGCYAAVQFAIGAGAPESWAPLAPALGILGAGVMETLISEWGRHRAMAWMFCGVAILIVHNYLGGMHLLRDSATDWNVVQTEAIKRVVDENDTLFTLNRGTLDRYVRYSTNIRVVSMFEAQSVKEASRRLRNEVQAAKDRGGGVYFHRDCIEPPSYLVRLDESGERALPALSALRTLQATRDVQPAPDSQECVYTIAE